MKPKLFKRSVSMLGGNIFTEYSVWWVCSSNTHEAYGATPEEAYKFWECLKGLYKKGCVAQFEFDMQYYSALQAQSSSSVQ